MVKSHRSKRHHKKHRGGEGEATEENSVINMDEPTATTTTTTTTSAPAATETATSAPATEEEKRDGLQVCLAVLERNMLDLEQHKDTDEAGQKANEAANEVPSASEADPKVTKNAKVLSGSKSIIIFVSF